MDPEVGRDLVAGVRSSGGGREGASHNATIRALAFNRSASSFVAGSTALRTTNLATSPPSRKRQSPLLRFAAQAPSYFACGPPQGASWTALLRQCCFRAGSALGK